MNRQPWLHALQICLDGPATVLSDAAGDIGSPGTGVIVDDRRVLSLLRLSVDGAQPDLVSSGSKGNTAHFLCCARDLGSRGADPTIEVHRRRLVTPDGMTEIIEVRSRDQQPVRLRLTVEAAVDDADIAGIKAGENDDPLHMAVAPKIMERLDDVGAPGVEKPRGTDGAEGRPGADVGPDGHQAWSGLRWSLLRHEVDMVVSSTTESIVDLSPAPMARWFIDLDIAPWQQSSVMVRVRARRREVSSFDFDAGSPGTFIADVVVAADDIRLSQLIEVSLTDARHLLLTDPVEPTDVFCAAGTPWYLTLFGRDSIWAARMLLPFGTDLAAGTLRALARRQGERDDPDSAEQPGKMPHEVRRSTFVDAEGGLQLPPLYYGSVDATPLWLCLLYDAWRWGMPPEQVRELLPAARAAMDWIERSCNDHPEGLLTYADRSGHGLTHQGWKDSGDSMRFTDGGRASPPIALLEAQGYAVAAASGLAEIWDSLGERGSARLRRFSADLTQRIRDRFWTGEVGSRYLAMAIDRAGRLVDGVASNMGHLLDTPALDHAEAVQVANRLVAPDLLGPFGISTLSRLNPGYNPLGYHTGSVWTHDNAIIAAGLARRGLTGESAQVLRALVRAGTSFDYRWPELYSGDAVANASAPYPASCRPQGWAAASAGALISALLGLTPDAPHQRLQVAPMRPPPFGAMSVDGLRFGGQRFSVRIDVAGQPVVEGLPDDWVETAP